MHLILWTPLEVQQAGDGYCWSPLELHYVVARTVLFTGKFTGQYYENSGVYRNPYMWAYRQGQALYSLQAKGGVFRPPCL